MLELFLKENLNGNNISVGCNAVEEMGLITMDYNECLDIICNFPTIYKTGDKSPRDILKQSGYADISEHLTEDKIAKHIDNNFTLVDTWLSYTEDIRHNPAWGLQTIDKSKWKVFYMVNARMTKEFEFDNSILACSKMIKMTMDEIKKKLD